MEMKKRLLAEWSQVRFPIYPGFTGSALSCLWAGAWSGFLRNWWHGGLGLRTCKLGCCGQPFDQWVPRTEYPAILMLHIKKV
ncbi:hypothetical protein Hanom_Chr13g01229001 [Helianthus anomalus]